jgi:hypothetical protein
MGVIGMESLFEVKVWEGEMTRTGEICMPTHSRRVCP